MRFASAMFMLADPTVPEIGAFVSMIAWFVVLVSGVLGGAVAIKKLREKPAGVQTLPQPLQVQFAEAFATKKELKDIDDQSRERAGQNAKRIAALETSFSAKHAENVGHLGRLDEKLDRNFRETKTAHEDLRKEVRHDVKQELTPLTATVTARAEDSEKQFREIAGQIGRLESAVQSNEALAAEVRQQMSVILQRLPRGGARP